MRKIIYLLCTISLLTACGRGNITTFETANVSPAIFPDYADVTIPVNIAPLNFKFTEACEAIQVNIKGKTDEIICNGASKISIPSGKWRSLLEKSAGSVLQVTVLAKKEGKWTKYRPFSWHVAADKIDAYLTYRLIDPGYELWNKMGIYQRNLEDYEQTPIYENTMNDLSCINCHSFCNQDPKTFCFHMRAQNTGTYLTRNGKMEKLNMKVDKLYSASRYVYWHPSGKYIAFSINETNQFFHSTDKNRVEVYDKKSEVVIYDVENHTYITNPCLMRSDAFETFPSFSADGKTLYFCSADSVLMPDDFANAKYSICKTDFNPDNGTVSGKIDTLFSARRTGKSATLPRISPDGSYLLFSIADYGQFHIWHKEADLYMINLKTNELFKPENVNSDEVESYHSWSSNSRWMVFSSRRVDGLHTVPFFSYMDKEGKTYKPFMLPQEDADFYDNFTKSYNIPEMVKGKVDPDIYQMDDIVKNSNEVKVGIK